MCNYEQELRSHISALSQLGNAVMPTILVDGDETPNNGKVPSLIRPDGTISLIRGRDGWSDKDLNSQIELANKHSLRLGIAIQPPQGLLIIDLDAQNYLGGKEELMHDYEKMVKASPILKNTRTERTTSGGLHIYVRVRDLTAWTKHDGGLRKNLCRSPYGVKRGELLSSNSVCITAPSYGRYAILEQTPIDQVVTIETLEQIGIYPCIQKQFGSPTSGVVKTSKLATGVRLRELLGLKASKVLMGQHAYSDTNSSKNDRSLQLVGFAKEAYGCENMAMELGIEVSESADELIKIVVDKFNLSDKADRVLASIEDDRSTYKPSRPEQVKQKLGVTTVHAGQRSNITANIAEREITKVYGEIRERIRTGDIVLSDGTIMDRDEIEHIYIELSKITPYNWNHTLAKHAILKLAKQNSYDHIKEYFLDLVKTATPLPDQQWNRLDQLLFGIDDPVAAMFMPKYLIGAVTRLMNPGCRYVATPILIGPQGVGKSASAQVLFGTEFVVDELGHDMDKDDLSRAHSFFCVELSEVDGITSKADRERFKAFLTRTIDVYRPAYGAGNVKRPRSFVFWGTSNSFPLNDPSGSRRFVVIDLRSKSKINPVPLQQIQQYRAAIWARAFQEYYAGTAYELSDQEQNAVNGVNALFTITDSWADRLTKNLSNHAQHTCLTVDDAFQIIGIPSAQQTPANQKRMREVLESMGYQSAKVSLPDGRRVTRLTRQIGKKQIPVDVTRCISF